MLFLLFTKAITPCAVCSVLSQPVVSDSLQPHGLQPARPLCPGDSPGMNTGVGCHTLLQGIFQTQGQNPGLLYCRQILYHLSQQGIKYLYCYLQNRITSGIGQSDYPQVFRREADVFYGNKFQKQCKASRNKQLINFILWAILCSVMKSCTILLQPAQDPQLLTLSAPDTQPRTSS